MSVNKIILMGHLGKDPELKEFSNGGKIATFSIATSERAYITKDGQSIPERTQWHNIQVNGKMADVAKQYLKKGSKIYLEGIVRYRKYTDSNNIERYITEVFTNIIQMLDSKNNNATPQQSQHPTQNNENPFSDDDSDLPF